MAGGSEGWYWWKNKNAVRAPAWTVASADPASGLVDEELGEFVEEMLRYDRGFQRNWRDGDGRQWHLIFTEWEPKRMSLHYAQPHLPEQCQRSIGREIVSKSELRKAEANGVTIAYNLYKIRAGADEFYLMYIINDDRISGQEVTVERATPANRWKAVWASVLCSSPSSANPTPPSPNNPCSNSSRSSWCPRAPHRPSSNGGAGARCGDRGQT
jgi:hypothetical protein